MSTEDDFADALGFYYDRSINQPTAVALQGEFLYGTYLGSESVDPDLSKIRLANGTVLRGCPRLSNATGLVIGHTVLCIHPGSSKVVTVLGGISGDITLYEAS